MQALVQKLSRLASRVVRGDISLLEPPTDHQTEFDMEWIMPILVVGLGMTTPKPSPGTEWDGLWYDSFEREAYHYRMLVAEGVVLVLVIDKITSELAGVHWPASKDEFNKLVTEIILGELTPA